MKVNQSFLTQTSNDSSTFQILVNHQKKTAIVSLFDDNAGDYEEGSECNRPVDVEFMRDMIICLEEAIKDIER